MYSITHHETRCAKCNLAISIHDALTPGSECSEADCPHLGELNPQNPAGLTSAPEASRMPQKLIFLPQDNEEAQDEDIEHD